MAATERTQLRAKGLLGLLLLVLLAMVFAIPWCGPISVRLGHRRGFYVKAVVVRRGLIDMQGGAPPQGFQVSSAWVPPASDVGLRYTFRLGDVVYFVLIA
jgi:hypothetical protein